MISLYRNLIHIKLMAENLTRYKIAFYTINDPHDRRSWSGVTYYMGRALNKNVGDVDYLGPVKIPKALDITFRGLQKLSRGIFKSEWIPKYSLLKNIFAARKLQQKMKGREYDILVAPAASSELAYLKTNIPVIYYGDATFKLYSEEYAKEFYNANAFSKWEGNHLEKKALENSTIVMFSSGWAAKSAIDDYHVPAEKIEVIQLGANIDQTPNHAGIFKKEQNRTLTLLFLSVDWERKGGPIAFDTLLHLLKSGIDVKMVVCGCTPPVAFEHPNMEIIPFLNKNEKEDLNRFDAMLSSVHFLLLPTRADCTPLVNCEANSYGVPAITTDVGGISEAVKDGLNGYCLPFTATGKDYAGLIAVIFADKERYHRLIESSRKMYDDELNWGKFAENFKLALKKHNL